MEIEKQEKLEDSDPEDYALGTTDRCKIKGLPLLSAEQINDRFERTDLAGMTIIKERKAEIRKKKIVMIDKDAAEVVDEDEEADEELLEEARLKKIDEIKALKRRGQQFTSEEKTARKEAIKALKNERKTKKQAFKEKFTEKTKVATQKNQTHIRDGDTQGVSVFKIAQIK